jgi:hypothetical protein
MSYTSYTIFFPMGEAFRGDIHRPFTAVTRVRIPLGSPSLLSLGGWLKYSIREKKIKIFWVPQAREKFDQIGHFGLDFELH